MKGKHILGNFFKDILKPLFFFTLNHSLKEFQNFINSNLN